MRTKTVKKASRVLVEKYYSKLTLDFDTNKRVAEDVAVIQTKRLRNKIAGFTTVRSSICHLHCSGSSLLAAYVRLPCFCELVMTL